MGLLYVSMSLSVTLLCHYYITGKSRYYHSGPNFRLERDILSWFFLETFLKPTKSDSALAILSTEAVFNGTSSQTVFS